MDRNQKSQSLDRNIRPQQFNPSFSRSTNPTKYYYPEKQINQNIAQELFLKITEGDISAIQNFILSNNVVLNVKDERGNSVIHQAIKNTNLNKNEKLELVKFLLDRGAPTMAYNDENVTPLHLAVKMQTYEIVNLLLEKNADPNAKDSQYMTPLHYAVQGKSIDCPVNRTNKKIIKDSHESNILFNDMTDAIRNLILNNNTVNQYLTHIKNTFQVYNKIFSRDVDAIKYKYQNNLENIISKNNVGEKSLEDEIKKQTEQFNNDIVQNMIGNIGDALKPFDINPKQKSGPYNVMPWQNKTEYLNKHKTNAFKLFKHTQQIMEDDIDGIEKSLNSMYNLTESIHTSIKNLYWYNAGFYVNTNDVSNNMSLIIKEYLSIDPQNMVLNDVAIDIYNKIPGNKRIYLVDLTTNNNVSWSNTTGTAVDLLKINKYFDVNLSPKNIKRAKSADISSSKSDYTNTIITDDRDIANPSTIIVNSVGKRPVVNPLRRITIDPPITITPNGGTVPTIPNTFPANTLVPLPGGIINTYSTFGYIDYDYTIVSQIRYYILRVKKYIEIIKLNNTTLFNYISTGDVYYVPNIISLNVTYIINCLLYINLISDGFVIAKSRLSSLGNKIDSLYAKNENNAHVFYLDMMRQTTRHMISGINDTIKFVENNFFGNVSSQYENYKNIIKFIDDMDLWIYITKYHNNFKISGESDYFWRKKTDTINSIFIDSFKHSETSIPTLNDTRNIMSSNNINFENVHGTDPNLIENINNIRKILIEKYIPQIENGSSLYYIGLHGDTLNGFSRLRYSFSPPVHTIKGSKMSLVSLDINIDAPTINIVPIDTPPISGFLFEISNTNIKLQGNAFSRVGLEKNNIPQTENYKLKNTAEIGYTSKSPTMKKTTAALPIVNINIRLHILTIRYVMIETMLNNIYNISTKGIQNADKDWANITNMIPKYRGILKKIIGSQQQDMNGVLYAVIGKIMDNIILNVINDAVYSASGMLDGIYRKLTKNDINKTYITNMDESFDLDLNELIYDVVGKYIDRNITLDDIDKTYQLNFTTPTVINNEKKKLDVNILYNYSTSAQKFSKQCYSIDSDIIRKLIAVTNINTKDVAGNSVLYYAIETQKPDIVEMILNNGGNANIASVKNNSGQTPLDHIKEICKTHIELLNKPVSGNIVTNISTPVYEKIKNQVYSNTQNKDNILRYSDVYLPMLLTLFNHYLFTIMNRYLNGWSFDDTKDLSYGLTGNKDTFINPKLPILEAINNFIQNDGGNGVDVLEAQKNIYEKNNQNISDEREELIAMNDNFAKELKEITNRMGNKNNENNENDANRIMEIRKTINKNNKKLNKHITDKNIVDDKIDKLDSNRAIIINTLANSTYDNIYGKLDTGDVLDIYDSIFWKIINSKKIKQYTPDLNYRSYPELMKKYIYENSSNNSILELHPYIQKYVYNVINKGMDTYVSPIIVDKIIKLYNNIISKTAKDYIELDYEYNDSNYVLKDLINLMEHCLKNTLFVSMYNSFVKIITKYIKTKYISDDSNINKSDFLNTLVDNILRSNIKGYTLSEYIFEHMPLKLLKVTLGIYDGDYDDDRSYTVDDLYTNIIDIIITNNVVPIRPESKLLKNLREIIVPYFKDYNDLFIKEGKSMMDGYIGYIASEANILYIYNLVNKHNN